MTMSAIQKRLTTASLHALDIIGELADKFGGETGDKAANAIKAISTIVKSVQAGFAREIDPATVLKQIDEALAELENDIAANDRATDNAIDAKFPPAG